jgi:hypothetical protein
MLSIYIRLLGKSYLRLFKEFPLLLQIIFVLLSIAILYTLSVVQLSLSVVNYAVGYISFVFAGRWICRISSPERILLAILNVPNNLVCTLKCMLLSVPSFFLDMYMGLLVLSLGTITIIFFPYKKMKTLRMHSLYFPTSYQWLSMYRKAGIWVLIIGFLLFLIALWHQNLNLTYFSLLCIITTPCFFTYYGQKDSSKFLSIYKNSSFLVWRKVCELLINSLIPALVCLPFLLLMDISHIELYIKCILILVYMNLLMFYCYYICYKYFFTAFILFCIIGYVSLALFISYPLIAFVVCMVVVTALHIFAIINLKSIFFHDKTESIR